MKGIKIISLICLMLFLFTACSSKQQPQVSENQDENPEIEVVYDDEENTEDETEDESHLQIVRIYMGIFKNTDAVAFSKLMAMEDNEETYNAYFFTVSDNKEELIEKFSNDELPILFVPTDMAAEIYKRMNGDVQVSAVITTGTKDSWNGITEEMPTSCIITKRDYPENHTRTFTHFLDEFKNSFQFIQDNSAEAAQFAVNFGVCDSLEAANAAISSTKLNYMSGEEMKTALKKLYDKLININPELIGGSVPDDTFYYILQ